VRRKGEDGWEKDFKRLEPLLNLWKDVNEADTDLSKSPPCQKIIFHLPL
jgi:hypothetical protein